MKRILVPTDFSLIADKARDYAIQLAQELSAEVTLLNSYHVPITSVGPEAMSNIDSLSEEAPERLMKKQMEYVNLNYSNIKFQSLYTPGLLVDSVRRICDSEAIDLVVMGSYWCNRIYWKYARKQYGRNNWCN